MYINFQQLARCNITQNELLLLIKISQKDVQFITAEDKDGVDKLLKEELVELTKQGKTIRERLRVSKKGKQFLRNVEKCLRRFDCREEDCFSSSFCSFFILVITR